MTGLTWGPGCRKTGGRAGATGCAGAVARLLRRVTASAAVAALAAAAAGCSAGHPVNTGPFGGRNWNTGQECVPISHPGVLVTDGTYEVRDSWRGTVAVISKISLIRPHGLRLLRAYAVTLHDDPLYGIEHGVPPHGDIMSKDYPWNTHVSAIGARVPYIKSPSVYTNLLLVLRTSARKSTDQGINVWYHVGSQDYQLRTGLELELLASPARC
jgi:hypothetical protein